MASNIGRAFFLEKGSSSRLGFGAAGEPEVGAWWLPILL